MKSLQSFITEAKSPRGTRGYVALLKVKDGSTDVAQIPYDADPEEAVKKFIEDPRKKYSELIEGPKTLTLKGYNWYCDEYLGIKYMYNDNGYIGGNYERDQWTAEEAWKILTDPSKKYTK